MKNDGKDGWLEEHAFSKCVKDNMSLEVKVITFMEPTGEAVEVQFLPEYFAPGSWELGIILYFFLSFNCSFFCFNKIKASAVGHQVTAS